MQTEQTHRKKMKKFLAGFCRDAFNRNFALLEFVSCFYFTCLMMVQ